MDNEIELLKRRLAREKKSRQQAEKIAEDVSRELYLKNVELEKALQAENQSRKELETIYKEVECLSRLDPLTGLNNRRSFHTSAQLLFQLSTRHSKELSCAMLDIDYFKQVNDSYGHDCGDKVLIAMANTCKKQLRETDLLARFGGEEFCLLLPETDLSAAALIAERIRLAISKLQHKYDDKQFSVTISIGVTKRLNTDDGIESMLKRSDNFLYQAKQNGRNRVVLQET